MRSLSMECLSGCHSHCNYIKNFGWNKKIDCYSIITNNCRRLRTFSVLSKINNCGINKFKYMNIAKIAIMYNKR